MNLDVVPLEGGQQGRHHPARIDARLTGNVRAAADGRRDSRLELPAIPAGQPFGVEPEPAMQLVAALQSLRLVAVERHVECAVRSEADLHVGLTLQLPREGRPAAK